MAYQFPKGFLWGAATSAHQVEGNNRNDWTEWELKNAPRLASIAQGKQWSNFILKKYPNPLQKENYISWRACDHYNRFREDFEIAKSLGHNTHRFSIEWSRIEPEEGKFDEKEIAHYREVIHALREYGMEPFVTLWHWTLPLWVRNQDGWENKKTVDNFIKYVEKIIDSIGGDIKFWIPLNEPTVYIGHSYVIGAFPPQIKSYWRANTVSKNLISAHKKSYALIHQKLGNNVLVGNAYNFHWHRQARSWHPLDYLCVRIMDYIRDERPLKLGKGCEDFIGVNYYYCDYIKFVLWGGKFGIIDIQNPATETSDIGWSIMPEGIYHVLKKLRKYKKPIYITENGLADAKDEKRAKFIRDHLRYTLQAIQEGVDVRGYFHWSLLDNFEWDKGFWPRFGLVEIDYKTQARKIRQSAEEYKKIIMSSHA